MRELSYTEEREKSVPMHMGQIMAFTLRLGLVTPTQYLRYPACYYGPSRYARVVVHRVAD